MSKQPEALRLAEVFEILGGTQRNCDNAATQAAAELRRLHNLNAELLADAVAFRKICAVAAVSIRRNGGSTVYPPGHEAELRAALLGVDMPVKPTAQGVGDELPPLPEPLGFAWHEGVVTASGGYSAGFGFDTSKPPDDYAAVPLYTEDQMRAALAQAPAATPEAGA
jgi:hypothetical protein